MEIRVISLQNVLRTWRGIVEYNLRNDM
jgi:hypothetical protein